MMTHKTFNVYAIGHAHIDPVWQWDKNEGYQEVFATFRSAVQRLAEFPSVCFVASSAQFYEWVLEADPDLFAQIKRLVQEGRWIPLGGWWVEADINCISGESLVRQGLLAQHFFNKHLGRKAHIGFSPDTFGHAWTLPQILKKQGMDAYFFMRPEPHEKNDLPAPLFHWQGVDGSKILTVAIISSYNAVAGEIEERIEESIARFSQTLPRIKDIAIFYGVGNHGGGPTIAAIQKITELRQRPTPGIHFASPEEYIKKIRLQTAHLPLVNDELQYHARGCYSACSDVKVWNRQTTNALVQAEKFATCAHILGRLPYPAQSLRQAWKRTLFNQFHDILAGTSIEEAYVDAQNDFGYAQAVADDTSMKALYALSAHTQTHNTEFPHSTPLVVFNPCSWPISQTVEFETEIQHLLPDGTQSTVLRNSAADPVDKETIVLLDAQGQSIPYQILPSAAAKQENQPFRFRFLFQAQVPALGFHVYRLDYSQKLQPPTNNSLVITAHRLENDHVRVDFDRQAGTLLSYFDKKSNREMLKNPGARAVVLEDLDDTWGHGIKAYDREIGSFAAASFKTIESGPERARLQVKSVWNNSFIVQDFALYRDSAELACTLTIDWHEKYRVLKLSFPTAVQNDRCTFSIPYGAIERQATGEEEPGQEWVDISSADHEKGWGLAIINNFTCGYSVKDGDIRLTCFHSTAWSHHNPEKITDQDSCRFMEQGLHKFSYRLVPHEGDWRQANIPQRAEQEQTPLRIVATSNHNGKLAPLGSLITTELANVSITALKMAEESESLVLRCVELLGQKAQGTVALPIVNRSFTLALEPFEIKTFLISSEPGEPIRETDLLEE